MTLPSTIASLLGVVVPRVEVLTYTGGLKAFLAWDPEARWFYWRWEGGKQWHELASKVTQRLQNALATRSPGHLDPWDRSAYEALIAAGIDTVDPDYDGRDELGRKQ